MQYRFLCIKQPDNALQTKAQTLGGTRNCHKAFQIELEEVEPRLTLSC